MARSTIGVGSTFWVELNLAPPTNSCLIPVEPLVHHQAQGNGGSAMYLLYVEDNQANMELVAQLAARRPDLRLLWAEDGVELHWHAQ